MNWVIGDVHGMYKPLRKLLDAVTAADPDAKLVFAGDYVNRGPDSRQVIDLLLTLTNARFVRGNHDDILDLILHGHCYCEKAAGGTPVAAYQWFMDYGVDRTFHSYGLDWPWLRGTCATPTPERMEQLVNAVPVEHRNFLRNLPPVVDGENFFVVHGYWSPFEKCYPPSVEENLHIHFEARQPLLWNRYALAEIDSDKPWGKRLFVGHTPIHTYFPDARSAPMVPIGGPLLTLLDTGCAIVNWGRLTAYCVEEDRFLQFNAQAEAV
jgi:serine/threonine protein phosphatase 1